MVGKKNKKKQWKRYRTINHTYPYETGTLSSIAFCNEDERKKETGIKKGLKRTLFFFFSNMPTYLDAHDLGNATEEQLKQVQNAPKDEFGVTHKNILYNKEENKAFCILDAPNKDAVEKTHEQFGMKCNWITEVKTTA